MNTAKPIHSDAALIERLGGSAKVAELLGLDKDGGTQRVFNWITRGIPPRIKLKHPAIFLAAPAGEVDAKAE